MVKTRFIAQQTDLQAPVLFLAVCYKKNTSSETIKFPNSIENTFQDFYFIIKSFCWPICDIWIFKCVKDFFGLVPIGLGTFLKFGYSGSHRYFYPVKEIFSLPGIFVFLTDIIKFFFQEMCFTQVIIIKQHKVTGFPASSFSLWYLVVVKRIITVRLSFQKVFLEDMSMPLRIQKIISKKFLLGS